MATGKQRAYIAGFIDADGCINMRKAPNYVIRVQVYNTKISVLLWIKDLYGGRMWVREAKGNSKTSYTLEFTARPAYALLSDIYPYLILKKEQAKILINFQKNRPKFCKMNKRNKKGQFAGMRQLSLEEKEKRHNMIEMLHILNKRGTN